MGFPKRRWKDGCGHRCPLVHRSVSRGSHPDDHKPVPDNAGSVLSRLCRSRPPPSNKKVGFSRNEWGVGGRSGQPWLQGKARWGEQRGKYRSHEMAGHGAGAQPRGEMEGKETLDASGQRTVRVQTLSWHAPHSSVFLVPDGKNTAGPVGSHPSLLWLCVLALGVLT